jgi:hypothetical protein
MTTLFQEPCNPSPGIPYPIHFRPNRNPGQGRFVPSADTDNQTSHAPEKAVVCRQCLHGITAPDQQTQMEGAHTHTFANPEGIVFEIACYQEAWGCGYVGPASAEFTWFAGYRWRIAVCANCLTHLGWLFSAPAGHFFHGLITSRIHTTEE